MEETWIETCKKHVINLYGMCKKHDKNMENYIFQNCKNIKPSKHEK